MGIDIQLFVTCDDCGGEHSDNLEVDEKAESILEAAGWVVESTLPIRILCDDCFEKESS